MQERRIQRKWSWPSLQREEDPRTLLPGPSKGGGREVTPWGKGRLGEGDEMYLFRYHGSQINMFTHS